MRIVLSASLSKFSSGFYRFSTVLPFVLHRFLDCFLNDNDHNTLAHDPSSVFSSVLPRRLGAGSDPFPFVASPTTCVHRYPLPVGELEIPLGIPKWNNRPFGRSSKCTQHTASWPDHSLFISWRLAHLFLADSPPKRCTQ